MRKLSAIVLGGVLFAGVGVAAASGANVTGTHVMVDLHFAAADGKTQTIAAPLLGPSAAAIQHACSDRASMQNLAKAVVGKNPNLAGMKFVDATCEAGSNGKIATSAESVPASTFNQPSPTYSKPAVIVFKYKRPNGVILTSVIGTKDNPIAGMDDCPAYLKKNLSDLVPKARGNAGDKFVGANCVAAPANVNSLITVGR